MKTIFKVIIGVLAAFVLLGIAGVACTAVFVDEVDKEMQKQETVTSDAEPAADADTSDAADAPAEEPEQQTTFKLGDTVGTETFEMTVANKANNKPDQYQDTTHGNIVSFDVEFKNLQDDKAYFASSDFNLYIDGELMEETFMGSDFGINGDVNAGRTLKGKIYFDAPAQGEMELVYEPSFSWTSLVITYTE